MCVMLPSTSGFTHKVIVAFCSHFTRFNLHSLVPDQLQGHPVYLLLPLLFLIHLHPLTQPHFRGTGSMPMPVPIGLILLSSSLQVLSFQSADVFKLLSYSKCSSFHQGQVQDAVVHEQACLPCQPPLWEKILPVEVTTAGKFIGTICLSNMMPPNYPLVKSCASSVRNVGRESAGV